MSARAGILNDTELKGSATIFQVCFQPCVTPTFTQVEDNQGISAEKDRVPPLGYALDAFRLRCRGRIKCETRSL